MAVAQDKRASELTAPVSIADTDVFPGYRPGTGGEPNLDIRASAGLLRAPIIAGLASGDVTVAASGVMTAPNVIGTNISVTAEEKLAYRRDVREWGASTSRSDNQEPINQAIAEISALNSAGLKGGAVHFPEYGKAFKINAPIIAKSNVLLVGAPFAGRPTNSTACRIYCDAGFVGPAMLTDTDGTFVTGFAVSGIEFSQTGTLAFVDAIRLRDPVSPIISECVFTNIGGRALALVHDASSGGANPIACQIERLFCYSALGATATLLSNAVETGAVHVEGVDSIIRSSEIGRNFGSLSSASMYGAAIHWAVTMGRIGGACVCQLSDVGLRITGNYNIVQFIRPDRNYGHGMIDAGNGNIISGVQLVSNGYGSLNTYDGFRYTGQRGNYSNIEVRVNTADAGVTSHKYGFNDLGSNSTQENKNRLFNCFSRDHGTSQYLMNNSFASHIDMNVGASASITQGSGVTSVTLAGPYGKTFHMVNAAARTLTNLFGIPNGMDFTILFDGNTTVTHGAYQSAGTNNRFVLAAGSDQTPAAGVMWHFKAFGNNLIQMT